MFEGVESPEDDTFLDSVGAQYVQGFLHRMREATDSHLIACSRNYGLYFPASPMIPFPETPILQGAPWPGIKPPPHLASGVPDALARRPACEHSGRPRHGEVLGASAIGTAILLALIPLFGFLPKILGAGDLATILVPGIGCGLMVYAMRFWKVLQVGSLLFFNGISMALAVYFTSSYPAITSQPSLAALWAGVWTFILGLFEYLLRVFQRLAHLPEGP